MSNIIKHVDFGMGYEKTEEFGPNLGHWNGMRWEKSSARNQEQMDMSLRCGQLYRRPLPILASHPEAIPLEPGEVLKFGERYLMRKGKALTYFGEQAWANNGKHYADETRDIIARLPKVAREAEKAKEEKVEKTNRGMLTAVDYYGAQVVLGNSEAARLYLENESVRAEVQRQEEAKRIGTDDWCMTPMGIQKCKGSVSGTPHSEYLVFYHIENGFRPQECRKLDLPPALIAALNAEIGASQKGAKA